jgi:hypothetical protein
MKAAEDGCRYDPTDVLGDGQGQEEKEERDHRR